MRKEMLVTMMKKVVPCLLALLALPLVLEAETSTPLREGWNVQSACKLQAGGDTIATTGFSVDGWLKATVPSTVLAAQAAAGIIPDPYFGTNLRQLPGAGYPIGQNFSNLPMPADSPYRCGWWYRKSFTTPVVSGTEQRFWLHFGGINYRGEVWVNGKKVADSATVAGAYRS
jgi:exo-1,4-beta-D-glucosaminidase